MRGGGGGKRDKQLIGVVLADDLGDLFLRFLLHRVGVRFVCLAERQTDSRAHLAFLRAVSLINQERDAQVLQRRILLEFFQHPGEFLLRGDDDRFAVIEKARQVVGLSGDAHHVFQVDEIGDVFPDVGVERFAVGEDERDVHQLFIRAGLEQAVQTVGEPADGKRFAAAGGMVGQIFFADVTPGGEMGSDVVGYSSAPGGFDDNAETM